MKIEKIKENLNDIKKSVEIVEMLLAEPMPTKLVINWQKFEQKIENCKSLPFNRVFQKHEKEAVEYLFNTFISERYSDLRLLAYALATVRIECGSNMVPVREGFKATDAQARAHVNRYGRAYAKAYPIAGGGDAVYYGRGYVQLTWRKNYLQEGIEDNPDKALEPEWAAQLLFKGLLDGRWNGQGHGLMYYLDRNDTYNARRTVNVTNKADIVADWYKDFLETLEYSVEQR